MNFWTDEPSQVVLEDQGVCEMLVFLALARLSLEHGGSLELEVMP